MNLQEEQLGYEKDINIALLKQMLSEEKKPPRKWVNMLVDHFIASLSTPNPTQRTNPTCCSSRSQ